MSRLADFGDSALGHALGIALMILAAFGGLSLVVSSCSDAAAACAEAGGSYDGGNGSCTMPDAE